MIELNKTQLTNKLKKLGKFIKENKKNDSKIYNKIQEIFPNSLEIDIYNESKDEINFLTGCEYTGRISKKELLNYDINFREIGYISKLNISISVENDNVFISSSVVIQYFDKYDVLYDTSITIKELNI